MSLLETIKSLNPLTRLAASPSSRAVSALREGQTLGEVMRDASDAISKQAVREALVAFDEGPAALFITCLIESTTAGYERLAIELSKSGALPRQGSAWVSARMIDYGASLRDDPMSQHLINLVLSVTGLHVEALILERKQIDARRLTEQLKGLLDKGLTSGISRSALAQNIASIHPMRRAIPAPRPSAS